MPRSKPPAAALLATPDDVEAQFYEALQQADLDKLMAVWSDDDDIACVHPGGPRVQGHAAIRASFEAIFANGAHGRAAAGRQARAGAGLRGAPSCRAHQRHARRRHAQRLGDGHQRLSEDDAGLAHGGAPRQPGQRAARSRADARLRQRCTERPATSGRCSTFAHRAGCLAATCRPSGRRYFPRRRLAPPPAYRRERWATPDARLHRCRLRSTPPTRRRAAAGAVPRARRLVDEPLRAGLRAPRRRAGLELCGAAFPWLLGRAEPGAARLPLGRLRRDRLDPAAAASRPQPAAATRWAFRWAATRCCAGPKKPAMRPRPWRARWPRCRRRSTWPRVAMPSAAASIGRSIRACSCAR